MDATLYQVFVTSTCVTSAGSSIHTNAIPALNEEHANIIAEQITDANVQYAGWRNTAIVIGGETR